MSDKDNDDFDDDFDFEDLDDELLDDEDWNDTEDTLDNHDDFIGDEGEENLGEKTFLQKNFNLIVAGVVVVLFGLWYITVGSSPDTDAPSQQILSEDQQAALQNMQDPSFQVSDPSSEQPPASSERPSLQQEPPPVADGPLTPMPGKSAQSNTPLPDLQVTNNEQQAIEQDQQSPELEDNQDQSSLIAEGFGDDEFSLELTNGQEKNSQNQDTGLDLPEQEVETPPIVRPNEIQNIKSDDQPLLVSENTKNQGQKESAAASSSDTQQLEQIIQNAEKISELENSLKQLQGQLTAILDSQQTMNKNLSDFKAQLNNQNPTQSSSSADNLPMPSDKTLEKAEETPEKPTENLPPPPPAGEKPPVKKTAAAKAPVESSPEPKVLKKPADQTPSKPVASSPAPTTPRLSWTLTSAQPGRAVLRAQTTGDLVSVEVGNSLPGLGQIKAITVQNGVWVVEGTQGKVTQ